MQIPEKPMGGSLAVPLRRRGGPNQIRKRSLRDVCREHYRYLAAPFEISTRFIYRCFGNLLETPEISLREGAEISYEMPKDSLGLSFDILLASLRDPSEFPERCLRHTSEIPEGTSRTPQCKKTENQFLC